MPVSAALLPIAVDDPRTMRLPVPLAAAILVSVSWGLFQRITWSDIAVVWAWDVVGHVCIYIFARKVF